MNNFNNKCTCCSFLCSNTDDHMHCDYYLGYGRLQNNASDRLRGCVEHGRHYHQYIRPARWTLGGKMQQYTDTIFVICCYRTHFA